jgi:hypothetical protein
LTPYLADALTLEALASGQLSVIPTSLGSLAIERWCFAFPKPDPSNKMNQERKTRFPSGSKARITGELHLSA